MVVHQAFMKKIMPYLEPHNQKDDEFELQPEEDAIDSLIDIPFSLVIKLIWSHTINLNSFGLLGI